MNKQQLLKSLKEMGFSKKILDAFSAVKREDFVPSELKYKAYEDTPLPIGHGQTISMPYVVAVMLSELNLKKGQKVLELGSGCGYVLALISEIVGNGGNVFGVEILSELAQKSKENLENYNNIQIYNKSGFRGLPEQAPFDRILVSAACRELPEALLGQLKEGGILVLPKGPRFEQELIVFQRKGNIFEIKKKIPGFIFVPFVGD